MTATLDAILDAQGGQMSMADLLAAIEDEERDGTPPEPVAADVIMIRSGLEGDVSQAKKGTEPHDGTCPYTHHCEMRRAELPHYRPGHPCHWVSWGDWRRCRIFKNYGGAPK